MEKSNAEQKPYEIELYVPNFKPDELSVKVNERALIVEGHHIEREENGSNVERHFIRQFILPNDAKKDELKSKLNEEGILNVWVPRETHQTVMRNIPIHVDPNWKMNSQCRDLALRQPIPLWWW
ncbi:unnamed protein product [Dracunculus medinensis]|uniref:SHSP domain-containing protein n=1 Tax=Dracunculus medinensis TaxID=318479 RepID=A0A0N4UKD8_DRAME|nr:unnamed protein product [Dracunculus medinensis]